jgi:hypothetical protein
MEWAPEKESGPGEDSMNATPQKRGRAALLGLAILGAAAGAVAIGFGSEATAADDHGNTMNTATNVALNAPVGGVLDSYADRDWFRLSTVPPTPLRVTAGGTGFVPKVEVWNWRMAKIATLPNAGTEMQGPYDYVATIPPQTRGPLYLVVVPAGPIGPYSLAIGSGDEAPVVPPTPPPGPSSPTDDVPAGTEVNITAASFFEGNIEVAGDTDTLLYVVQVQGPHEFRLTSEMVPDAVANAELPLLFQVNSWVGPHAEDLLLGTQVRLTVRSLSEVTGAYRLQVTPPPGAPMGGAEEPPPPPPPGPATDLLLPFDPAKVMPPKPSKDYRSWLSQQYRLTDPTMNAEGIDALAIRDRWIQMDNGSPALVVTQQDPTGAMGGALAPFGGRASARTRYPQWIRTQAARLVLGGGTLDQIKALVQQGLDARRPILLFGQRQGDNQLEAWVVFGIREVNGVLSLVVVDPSQPGRTSNLRLGPAGLLPVSSGGVQIKKFVFVGQAADVIYP